MLKQFSQSTVADVVLFNFGGPTAAHEVEPFLTRLFEDPFIIRAPLGSYLRTKLARRIAKKRAPLIAKEYEKIGYSPINRYTQQQATMLEQQLGQLRADTKVWVVNRYTEPFADEVIPQLRANAQLYLLSLYPHLCHSTTVSSFRDFDLAYARVHGHYRRDSIRIYSWWSNPSFIDYWVDYTCQALEKMLQDSPSEPITVLCSAHGLPQRYLQRGDPYVFETYAHARMIEERVTAKLEPKYPSTNIQWQVAFQSRVGPVEWVRPYTHESIPTLAKERGGQLLLLPISFTSDHIETLYEMDVTYQGLALSSGFQSYQRVSAANDDPRFTGCLKSVLEHHGFLA